MEKCEKGSMGEKVAAAFYKERGYAVIAGNWRFKKLGEIDLILYKDNLLVFCEVKMRTDYSFARPSAAVNYKKQKKLRLLSEIFLKQNPQFSYSDIRFDVVEADFKYNINCIENAF